MDAKLQSTYLEILFQNVGFCLWRRVVLTMSVTRDITLCQLVDTL